MRYFIDTEFIESGPGNPIYLLSIGIVAADGRELYLEWENAPVEKANQWVRDNVLRHLGQHGAGRTLDDIRDSILQFVGDDPHPQFWGYFADYDWVVFCQIFGCMVDLPKGWPMYCRDIKQWCDELGNPALPPQSSTEHDALNDARWNMQAWDFLANTAAGDRR